MNKFRLALAAALVAAASTASALAQPAAAPQQGAPAARPSLEGRLALISTDAFSDEKVGIARFVQVIKRVDAEFEPRRAELRQLRTRYDQLAKELTDQKSVADQAALARKADEADSLKKQIDRKAEDATAAYERRMKEAVGPVQQEVFTALDAYAKERGIAVIIDASRVPILYGTDAVNITADFIRTYNQRNPATAGAPATPATGGTTARPAGATPARP